MHLLTQPYLTQLHTWPTSGRHILAQFDDSTIVVYQAYRWIVNIEDITPFVHEQHKHVLVHDEASLIIPQEQVYPNYL